MNASPVALRTSKDPDTGSSQALQSNATNETAKTRRTPSAYALAPSAGRGIHPRAAFAATRYDGSVDDWEARLDAAVGWAKRGSVAEAWLEDIGFPAGESIVRADTLEPKHRAAALALAERDDVYIDRFALPSSNRVRRRWLGLDPPSPLERPMTVDLDGTEVTGPMWWVWRTCEDDDEAELVEEQLSAAERLEAAAELELAGDEGYRLFDSPELINALDEAGATAASWARTFADDVLALFADGERHPENGMQHHPTDEVRLAAIVPLALAKAPWEARWEPLVPLTRNRCFMQAIARMLPADRREAMLLHRCENGLVLHAIDGALHTLAVFDLPELKRWLGAILRDRKRAQLPADILSAKKAAFAALP